MASVRGIGVAVITSTCGGTTLLAQRRARCATPEAVLFVDYGKPEVAEFDLVLNNGMSAHKDMQRTFGELCRYEASFLCFRASVSSLTLSPSCAVIGPDCLEVLGGENLGGGHQAGLESVVDCQKHAHQGHNGFAAAYISPCTGRFIWRPDSRSAYFPSSHVSVLR